MMIGMVVSVMSVSSLTLTAKSARAYGSMMIGMMVSVISVSSLILTAESARASRSALMLIVMMVSKCFQVLISHFN